MHDKKHCCCCIILSDGVFLVGIYGMSFHASLLIIQTTQGHTLTPAFPVDPNGNTIVHPLLIVVHSLGILVNGLLVLGIHFSQRVLMVPWLIGQGVLSVILLLLALYYLILFPRQECPTEPDIFTTECHILLWHSVIMVCSVLTLFYYFYVVHEFVAQLHHHEKCTQMNFAKDEEEPVFVIVEEEPVPRVNVPKSTPSLRVKKEKRVRIQEPF
ncbi:hypothetical protein TCAL_15885 [Tigriopus californicus]|uniref:Uncharacterized protein n=1 Tax=Tigriopus californicus TaxID=6832 RepID=A0A553NQT1_TIGCA|nr:hypothetical protein TCAL_15885 [Tigriopus californicus]